MTKNYRITAITITAGIIVLFSIVFTYTLLNKKQYIEKTACNSIFKDSAKIVMYDTGKYMLIIPKRYVYFNGKGYTSNPHAAKHCRKYDTCELKKQYRIFTIEKFMSE